MTSLDDVLEAVRDCQTSVAALRTELHEYKENTSSDIRELKAAKKESAQSLTDLRVEAAQAQAIVAKAKWDQVVTFGWGIAKWFAVASLGGCGKVLWDMLVKR